MTEIQPTIGRVILYVPASSACGLWQQYHSHGQQAFAATVCKVNGDGTVNLQVIDYEGLAWAKTDVPVRQPDFDLPPGTGYAEWMPYQVGQAAKTETQNPAIEQCSQVGRSHETVSCGDTRTDPNDDF